MLTLIDHLHQEGDSLKCSVKTLYGVEYITGWNILPFSSHIVSEVMDIAVCGISQLSSLPASLGME
jgi:hypothetical protein